MYPFLRLFSTLVRVRKKEKKAITAICETTFRCMPWDVDMFFEANNGRILTLYDLGRFGLFCQTDFWKVLRHKQWMLTVIGSSVRYRKRIRMFDKVTIKSQVVGFEDRWLYISQSMWVKGEAVSSVLVRKAVIYQGQIVSTEKQLQALNITNKPQLSEWEKSWAQSESWRTWPPSP